MEPSELHQLLPTEGADGKGRSGVLLLLLLILLGTVTDVTPDLSRDAGNASPASEGGQGMADPLNNLGAEPTHAG